MRVLVVGGGGREHALAWKIAQSPLVTKLYAAPGNPGIAEIAECVEIAADDVPALADFAEQHQIDLTVVGPEKPLALGLVDELHRRGLRAFGPTRAAARIESSKSFAKQLMQQYGIPTASFAVFEDSGQALQYLASAKLPVVVKADGLAAGKGVIIAQTREEARAAVKSLMENQKFGAAGSRIVVEEYLEGEEASLLAFVDGTTVVPMVSAQDHKRAFDGDRGPNTGGMGAYSPAPVVTGAVYERVVREILQPVVEVLHREGSPYAGVLYAGLMITDNGPKVLEFNCRFGDPETQVILPRLSTDLVEIMLACCSGQLANVAVQWCSEAAVCVILASGGYPGNYEKGKLITGLDALPQDVLAFHAGTKQVNGRLYTDGGRVLGLTALAPSLAQAVDKAYRAVDRVSFDDMHYRTDIAAKGLRHGD